MNNQYGISSLILLFAIVLGVFLLWEANEYIRIFNNPPVIPQSSSAPGPVRTFCPTGEEGNCNDSNDSFIFTE